MSTPSDTRPNGASPAPNDPDVIREDIERTRENLADTIDALHAKLDVKSQARARFAAAKDRATTDSGKPRPEVLAGAIGAMLLVAGLVWWRKE